MNNPYKLLFGPGLLVCSAEPQTYGFGDFNGPASVQQAIDTMAAQGVTGKIIALPGTYNSIVVDVADLVIEGCGWTTLFDGGITAHAVSVTADNVQLLRFACKTTGGGGQDFDALRVGGSSSHTIAEGVCVVDSDRWGVLIAPGTTGSCISNCTVLDYDTYGFGVDGPGSRIHSNYIAAGATGNGIYVYDDGDNFSLVGNHVVGTITIDANAENGLAMANVTDGAITDNSGTSLVVTASDSDPLNEEY